VVLLVGPRPWEKLTLIAGGFAGLLILSATAGTRATSSKRIEDRGANSRQDSALRRLKTTTRRREREYREQDAREGRRRR
jgi:hypothetical protein